MMQDKSHQRKQYLINPGFQWKVAGTIAVAVFLFSILISITLYGTLHQQARLRAANPTGYSAEVTWVMICFGLGFSALTAGGVGLWSVLMTHRICGPLYVMKRYLLELAEGRLPSLRPLRKKDEFKDLYDALDQAIMALRTGKQRELMQLSAALEALRQAESTGSSGNLQSVAQRIETLRVTAQESLRETKPLTQSEGRLAAAISPEPA